MGWQIVHVCGRGINLSGADGEIYRKFLQAHKESVAKKHKKILRLIEKADPEEIMDIVYDNVEAGSVAEPIAYIINKETNIPLSFPGPTEEGDDCVLFCPDYPWGYKQEIKTLTKAKLDRIMKKYAAELNLKYETGLDMAYCVD